MQTTAARIGFMPAATSIAAVIATGEPKPASASSRAPKQKAIRMASTRMSVEIDWSSSPSTLSQPWATERLYRKIALTRIHMIWNRPMKTPWKVVVAAVTNGMPHTATARMKPRVTATSADFHAAILNTPSITNSVINGTAATRAERAALPPTGARGWMNRAVTEYLLTEI